MSDDETKPELSKITAAAMAMAAFAAITSTADGARSYFEREHDVKQAAAADANRVAVDNSIQDGIEATVEDLYDRIEGLEDSAEDQDRELFELRVTVSAQERIISSIGAVSAEARETILIEALEDEALKENMVATKLPTEENPEARIKKEAKRVGSKKRYKDHSSPEKLKFIKPEAHYQTQQQLSEPAAK